MEQTEGKAQARAKDQRQPISPKVGAWEEVLQFWFLDRLDEDLETHGRHWAWRMRGGPTLRS